MLGSVLAWLVPAVGLCWLLGAYNRLIRLRTSSVHAFGDLERELGAACAWAQARLPDEVKTHSDTRPGMLLDDTQVAWSRMASTLDQLLAALAAARRSPLSAEQMLRVSNAFAVLQSASLQVECTTGDDEPNDALNRLVNSLVSRIGANVAPAQARFNQAVDRYNAAIGQFPASLVARLSGLAPATGLALRGVPTSGEVL